MIEREREDRATGSARSAPSRKSAPLALRAVPDRRSAGRSSGPGSDQKTLRYTDKATCSQGSQTPFPAAVNADAGCPPRLTCILLLFPNSTPLLSSLLDLDSAIAISPLKHALNDGLGWMWRGGGTFLNGCHMVSDNSRLWHKFQFIEGG